MDTVKKPAAISGISPYLKNGQAAVNARNMTEAVGWFEKAVRENPKDAQAMACYGQALCWIRQHSLGIEYLRKAGALLAKACRKQRDTGQLLLLVEQLQFWNDYPGSLELIKQAVQIKKDVRGFQLLAHTYSRLNQNQLAFAASLQVLRLAPDDPVLNLQHAMLEAGRGEYAAAIARLLRILRMEAIGKEQAFRTHKELARIYDKQGEYARVFEHLHAAAALSAGLPEVQKQEPRFVYDLLAAYTAGFDAELLRRWSGAKWREEKRAPAFLIGFFRSGTTLTQEILSTDPNVFISDETDLVVAMKDELNRMSSVKDNVAEQLRLANQDTIQHLRDFYWRLAAQRYGEHAIQGLFIDKTTMNTFDVGLINAVFPDAKVIFMLRDPRDVCLSCYMQVMIPSAATVHLFNWRSTAELYAETMRWWLHVKPLLSVDVMTFRYEDGIADFQGTFRRVFEFLGLAWHQQADQFYKQAGQKFIASPSFGQVSQPLYASSVGRWRYYAAEFDAVDDLLQPYIEAYGYCTDVSGNVLPTV
ncbi:tetratricopeptide repeat-containing sulfotransferase family protein [Methylomonas methanica]|uniref:Sulfotransferase n=1 Tax=Methylomonas methanica (strain DSM 25384 / MC09) TaxID=857087 RepID=F9ZZ65_METMM|nr:sulfotransferase [Methylomonas methanica]AEG01091.1 sulfotransferase [Methylomonas methanica MC09]